MCGSIHNIIIANGEEFSLDYNNPPIFRDVLPVQHRISYKIVILARDYIHGIGPAYFGDVHAQVTDAPGRTSKNDSRGRTIEFSSLKNAHMGEGSGRGSGRVGPSQTFCRQSRVGSGQRFAGSDPKK